MSRVFSIVILCLAIASKLTAQSTETRLVPSLNLKWETDSIFPTVESVLYDGEKEHIYTANINGHFMKKDGNGSISRMRADGTSIQAEWISGLNAPTGLAIHGDRLYTTDIDEVISISISTGQIVERIPIEGAKALNDICTGEAGILYCSDTGGNQVFKIEKGQASILIDSIDTPNGLLIKGNQLLITQWTPRTLTSFNLYTKKRKAIAKGIPWIDGLASLEGKGWITASWGGLLHFIAPNGEKTLILDTREEGMQAPDISYIPSSKTLLVATFNGNKIRAYDLTFVPQVIDPIRLDPSAISGLGLKKVTSSSDPDRLLFQRRLFQGNDISVYVVASETKTAKWEDYGIEEFIYVINGRARLHPAEGKERFYYPGDFFLVPKGYKGAWETQGGQSYYHELSIIANERTSTADTQLSPVLMDKAQIAGINISPVDGSNQSFHDLLHHGQDLKVITQSEHPNTVLDFRNTTEQLIYIIAGALTLQAKGGESMTFQTGDFFILPHNFVGSWVSEGHQLFRTLRVEKAK